MDIVNYDKLNLSDPIVYCRLKISENKKRFLLARKRKNLGDRIGEIYVMKHPKLNPPSISGYFIKDLSCDILDEILSIQKRKHESSESNEARRKLFFPYRSLPRKPSIIKKNTTTAYSTIFMFRNTHKLKNQNKQSTRTKKKYLDEARQIVQSQIARERESQQQLLPNSPFEEEDRNGNNLLSKIVTDQSVQKRSRSKSAFQDSNDSNNSIDPKRVKMCVEKCPEKITVNPNFKGMLLVKTDTGVFPIDQQKLSEVCKYHKNMARKQPPKIRSEQEQIKRDLNTEACRLSRRVSKLAGIVLKEQYRERIETNNKIVEESIRSIHYLKALLDMLMERE